MLLIVVMSGCKNDCVPGKNYQIKDNVIVFDEPQRVEGQTSMLEFAAEPIENVRIGFIGLGMRGPDPTTPSPAPARDDMADISARVISIGIVAFSPLLLSSFMLQYYLDFVNSIWYNFLERKHMYYERVL